MRYVVLAAGFDGTLARAGRCDQRSIAALHALAASGRKLILATSRELRDLLDVFPEARLFDYLVAENGAVIHCPAARESAILAQAPSETLIHELRRRQIEPLSIGSVVVTTSNVHRRVLQEAIEKLRLDCYLLDNGSTIAVLPNGVSKASGVSHVLDELALSYHNLVAVGDAENDLALFELAEHGTAVANASAALKQAADRVTRAAFAEGVEELALELLDCDLAGAPTRRNIHLGTRSDQHAVTLSPGQCSLLVSGPAGSARGALCRRILGQYLAQQYQCCVVGAYSGAAFIEHDAVSICGDEFSAPSFAEISAALERPLHSAVVNVAAIRVAERPRFARGLFDRLATLNVQSGRPHLIVLDQMEGVLNAGIVADIARLKGATHVYVSAHPEQLPREALESVDVAVALGESAPRAMALAGAAPAVQTEICAPDADQALVWVRGSGTAPFRVELETGTSVPASFADQEVGSTAVARARSLHLKNDEPAIT